MKLYNALSRSLEELTPIDENSVKMYVCGITPYDTTHIGHAFTYIFFDTLLRYLRYKGFKVAYTQNVTDINDRDNDILKRAKEQGTTWKSISKFWTDKFLTDMQTLNWVKPDNYLWASNYIPQITDLIEHLLKHNFAYQKNGGVYLDIEAKKDFGKLSRLTDREMIEMSKQFEEDLENPDKKHPLDITLWRPTTPNQPEHIPSFESPFGPGRPGWHIECSAMAINSLGEQIDIHGGGVDLIYPHHESELAQSEGATGKSPFSKYWIHTEIVAYNGQKMSKSLGNLVMVSDLLKKYSPNAIRYLLLSHHYREPWEFFETDLVEAEKKIELIKEALNGASSSKKEENSIVEFEQAMDDDMNTPQALEIMSKSTGEELRQMANILGFKF